MLHDTDKESDRLQDTESRILRAAEKEFFEKGFAGARTTSIAEAAGATHAMLHYYFRTKDKLFERIVVDKTSMLAEIVLSAVGDGDLPLEERIRQGIERHFDFVAANRELPRFLVNEVYAHPERLETMKTNMRNMAGEVLGSLQREIDEYARQERCRQVDARMLLIDIVSLNVFPFMAAPIVGEVIGGPDENYDEFLAMRKKENVETILRKLEIR